jgi:lysozyme
MEITWEDTEILRQFEGCKLDAYPDPATGAEPITIGWGSTRYTDGSKVKMGDKLTQQQADDLMLEEAKKYWDRVKILVKVQITRNQLAALTSFAYNVGPANLASSTLLKMINNGDSKESIGPQFLRWNKAAGKEMLGLTRRRAAERDLFLKD